MEQLNGILINSILCKIQYNTAYNLSKCVNENILCKMHCDIFGNHSPVNLLGIPEIACAQFMFHQAGYDTFLYGKISNSHKNELT